MADIKLRKVDRNTIKTLDHAASAMHHVKEMGIRTRSVERDPGSEDDDRSTNSYAQNRIERAAGSTAYAVRRGAEIIKDRHEEAAMTDNEVARNTEEFSNNSRIRKSSLTAKKRQMRKRGSTAVKDRQESPKTASQSEDFVLRQKGYGRRKLIQENAIGDKLRFFAFGSGNVRLRIEERVVKALRRSKTLLRSMTAGGMFSVGLIVIMILFGAAFTMTEDGGYIVGTGDTAIVEVARAQLGNVGGEKYWRWYGFKTHVHWCCCFVSWCADQCGYIDAGIMPKFAGVDTGVNWFKARHRWAGRGYVPHPGDTIFFDFERDGVLDHVGIVETCDGKSLTTIEGNYSDACKRAYYSVGDSRIAGYGLMVRPAGNKARLIALKATQLAYPDAPSEAKYHGGKPTAAYAAALERAYPNRSGWGQPSKDGASCDVFVGVCLVDSGVDKGFPRGYRDQAARLAKRTDLYECVISTTSRNISESELKDGDICTWEKSSGTVHIWIYTSGKAKQAAHDKWYPRTTSTGNNLKISGKKVIRVYRIKD